MADFLFIALRYARKLNRELQKLADAADQIRQQNLVFTPQNRFIRIQPDHGLTGSFKDRPAAFPERTVGYGAAEKETVHRPCP